MLYLDGLATSHFLHHSEPHLLPSPGVFTRLCLPPLPRTLFPLGMCDELPGEGRWEPGQDRKLCLSFPLGTPARPIKSVCPTLLSLVFLSRGMEQRVREAVAVSTSAPAPSASEPFLSWGMGLALFSFPFLYL
uniref:Prefoldin subunit 1 n=1 Tax=Pan troglodytes TaxID=9598 RepID=K7BIR5_PANTR